LNAEKNIILYGFMDSFPEIGKYGKKLSFLPRGDNIALTKKKWSNPKFSI